MKLAGGLVQVAVVGGDEQLYSEKLACPDCGISVPQLEPRSFSFNSLYGACPECHGLGSRYDFDPAKVITDWSKPLLDGGLGPGSASQGLIHALQVTAAAHGIDLNKPFEKFPQPIQDLLLMGESGRGKTGFRGIFGYLKQNLEESTSEGYRDWLMDHMSATECPACRGKRLRPESLAVKVNRMSIAEFTALPISRALEVAQGIKLAGREEKIAGRVMHEVVERLQFLNAVGLNYISLDRSAATLSGGEGQRIRLATQIGSRLRGVLYVLDEPSIGLHHRDNGRLLNALENLRDLGNTVLVVEHDEETIRRADYVIDLGPGAGRHGGGLVAHGTPEEIMREPNSLTGAYISGRAADRDASRAAAEEWRGADHSRREGKQSQESRCNFSARRDDGGDRSLRLGQVHAGQRHSLPRAGAPALPFAREALVSIRRLWARRISTKSFASINRRSGARRARIPQPIPACSHRFAISMPCCRSRASAATSPDVFPSTFPAAAARRARAKASAASR